MARFYVQRGRCRFGHSLCVSDSPRSCAGICVARIRDDCLCKTFQHALRAQPHRRGANLICGKQPGNRRTHIGSDQREIELPSFDAAKHRRRLETERRANGTWDDFETLGSAGSCPTLPNPLRLHNKSSVSPYPRMILKH